MATSPPREVARSTVDAGRSPVRGRRRSVAQQATLRYTATRYIVLVLLSAVALLPVWAAIVASLTKFENIGSRLVVPLDWHFENFVDVWFEIPLAQYLLATTVYALMSACGCVIVAVLASFALSRMRFRGSGTLLYSLLVTQVIPLIVLALPMFHLARSLGLYDTYFGIGLAVTVVHLAFPVMFLKSYFDGIPREIEEAAQVDGCSQLQSLILILLPAARPAIFTAFALVFFTSWQIFLIPLVLSNSADKTPVSVGIFRMLSDSYTPWHLIMAAALIASIPPIAIFLMAQRHLIGGLTAGAVK